MGGLHAAFFVDSLVERFDIEYKLQTPASVEFNLRPTISVEIKGN